MYRILSLAAVAAMVTAPAFAANTCSTAAASKFQPKTALESQLKTEGTTVRRIKTEKGCYEVYGINKAGKKVNLAFNAETLAPVGNPEAGEN